MQEQSNTSSTPDQQFQLDQELKYLTHLLNLADTNLNKERGIQTRQVSVARNHIWIASMLAVLSFALFDHVVSGHTMDDLPPQAVTFMVFIAITTLCLLASFCLVLRVTGNWTDYDYAYYLTLAYEDPEAKPELAPNGTARQVSLVGYQRTPEELWGYNLRLLESASNCYRNLCAQSVERGKLIHHSELCLYAALFFLTCCIPFYLWTIL